VIFVDSNVPMYLVGASHPNKARAQALLETAVAAGDRLVTDAEVLQEILRRFSAIQRLDAVQPTFDVVLGLVDEVFPIEPVDVEGAKDVLLGGLGLSARDSLHVALMRRHGVRRVMSFDADFDRYPGLMRLA
jgi:predicted nucleic acid-binding protein